MTNPTQHPSHEGDAKPSEMFTQRWECRACNNNAPCTFSVVTSNGEFTHLQSYERSLDRGCPCKNSFNPEWVRLPDTLPRAGVEGEECDFCEGTGVAPKYDKVAGRVFHVTPETLGDFLEEHSTPTPDTRQEKRTGAYPSAGEQWKHGYDPLATPNTELTTPGAVLVGRDTFSACRNLVAANLIGQSFTTKKLNVLHKELRQLLSQADQSCGKCAFYVGANPAHGDCGKRGGLVARLAKGCDYWVEVAEKGGG